MIRLQDYTPEIYYKESRDFQLLGRLYDLVLNSVKTDADLIYGLPINLNSDEQMLNLLALTLGFKTKHHYSNRQLRAICSVFPIILKNKGSITAILTACNALFNAEGLEQQVDYDFVTGSNKTELNLYIPASFGDTVLLNDLLSYVLPAGMSCHIIKELRIKVVSNTEIDFSEQFTIYKRGKFNNNPLFYDNNTLAMLYKPVINGTTAGKTEEEKIAKTEPKAFADNIGFRTNGGVFKPTIPYINTNTD